jgi:hypothetical protein
MMKGIPEVLSQFYTEYTSTLSIKTLHYYCVYPADKNQIDQENQRPIHDSQNRLRLFMLREIG